jgi:NitT/TauT family transport system permease protein
MFTGNTPGIGKRIYDSNQLFRIKEMYASIIFVGILGYTLNKLLSIADDKLVHWKGK